MVLLLILLWSICAIYIIHFLETHKMRVAAVAYAVLYCYLLVWFYAVVFFDLSEYGLTPGHMGHLHGSSLYFSFLELHARLGQLSAGVLEALAYAAVALALTVLWFFVISGYRLWREIRRLFAGRLRLRSPRREPVRPGRVRLRLAYPIWLRHCRMND